MHPTLKPGLRLLWRDARTAQIGIDPDTAVVVAGLAPPVARVLDRLDGSLDEQVLLGSVGASAPAVRALLTELRTAGVLADARTCWPGLGSGARARLAPDLAAGALRRGSPDAAAEVGSLRGSAAVEVVGAGRVGSALARLLAAAGVGTVVLRDAGTTRSVDLIPGGWEPADVGGPRSRVLRGLAPPAVPDLVVLCPHGPAAPDGDLVEALWAAGTTHLVASVAENRGVVGPLVVPPAGPCQGCLEAHRSDRDPAWPLLRHQLSHPHPGAVDACDVTLATMTAALGARQVIAWLERDDEPPTEVADGALGATLEVVLGSWRVRRRTWPSHPGCRVCPA